MKSDSENIEIQQKGNANGKRIIEYVEKDRIKIMSTHFKRKDNYKGTWVSSDDPILICEEHNYLI